MRILQINTYDIGGGSGAVSRGLHQNYHPLGEETLLSVGRQYGDDTHVVQIEKYPQCEIDKTAQPLSMRFARLAHRAVKLHTYRNIAMRQAGRDVLHYPSSERILETTRFEPDIIQCHNLHGHYFDLRSLPKLSRRAPIVLTLHDCWLLGGHCAHSFDCKRWRTGCGNCPGLNIPNRIRRDASAANWADRRAIFSQFQYRVSAPCQWLMDKVNASLLDDNMLEGRVIPNGVDLRTFYPADKKEARTRLRLDLEAKIVLFVGTYTRSSPWRDYSMLEKALSRPEQEVMLLCVGEEGEPLNDGRLKVRSLGPINEPARMADLYRAADVYAHPAIQDTFPTTVLEAMACGVPVVATSVGGIPEQIKEGVTGHLVPSGDVTAMRARLMDLLNDDVARERMGRRAGEIAAERFDIVRQARTYVEWFRQLT